MYHGTTKENHDKILRSGCFQAGTYFAKHLEDALGYGGLHVFEVLGSVGYFEGETPEGCDLWQVRFDSPLSTDLILRTTVYERVIGSTNKDVDEVLQKGILHALERTVETYPERSKLG